MNNTIDYFCKDIKFTGKHAEYIDELWKQNNIQNSYIKTLYELYGLSAIIGLKLKRKGLKDSSGSVSRNLQVAQMNPYKNVLMTVMHIVLLLDDGDMLSDEEKVRRAFSPPKTEEERDRKMELFNSYVRGGIEYLYEELIERPLSNEDEYTDIKAANIIALLKNEVLIK